MPKEFNHRLTFRSRMFFGFLRFLDKVGLSKTFLKMALKRAPQARAKMEKKTFEGYTPTEHDVFVAVYPKSGNNWTMQIAQQIVNRGVEDYTHIHDVVAWPHAPLSELVIPLDKPVHEESPTKMRVIKTQLKHPATPYNEHGRYIVVLRDPKDVVVSMYHFANGLIGNVVDVQFSLDALVNAILQERFPLCWAEHNASWWALKDKDNVQILTFPEMKQDLKGTVETLAKFMEVVLTIDEVDTITAHSEFPYMKENEQRFSPPWPTFRGESAKMLRSGKVGDAKKALTDEQRTALDEHYRQKLAKLGSNLPYDALFGESA